MVRWLSVVGLVFMVVSCSGEREMDQDASTLPEAAPTPPTTQRVAVVSDSSVGCLELGAPVDAVSLACGGARDTVLRVEGQSQPAVAVDVGGGTATGEIVNGRVWRITVTDPALQTADSIGVGTPVNRLADYAGVRIVYGEGTFARMDAHCGKSFGLRGLADRRGGWTSDQLRALPDTVRVVRILVVGHCDHG